VVCVGVCEKGQREREEKERETVCVCVRIPPLFFFFSRTKKAQEKREREENDQYDTHGHGLTPRQRPFCSTKRAKGAPAPQWHSCAAMALMSGRCNPCRSHRQHKGQKVPLGRKGATLCEEEDTCHITKGATGAELMC
jgi:hypothetical protein